MPAPAPGCGVAHRCPHATAGGFSCTAFEERSTSGTAPAAPARAVPASSPTARREPGLTPGPQAATASPAARMLRAALRSRSCVVPHPGQVHSRTLRGLGPSLRPHAEQYCDDGYQRSTLTSVRLYSLALYSSIPTNVDHPTSWIDLARLLRPRATTFSVSTHTVWCSRTRRVES